MALRASNLSQAVRAWPRRVVFTVGSIIVLLLVVRIALPYVVKRSVNQRLQHIPAYTGNVNSVGIHLWRGAYSLHDLSILRKNGRLREPFFRAKGIDLSIAWRELLHGKIVSDVQIDQGQLSFVKGPTTEESQTDLDRRWQKTVQDLVPIDITHLEMTDGLVRYIDTSRDPKVDLFVTHMHLSASGLRNRPGEEGDGEFPAKVELEGKSLGGGDLRLSLEAEPLADEPHFHLGLKLDNVDLVALNESLRAYVKVEVKRGDFQFVAEMAGKDGGFQGYVKPFFENLDFGKVKDKDEGLGEQIWGKVVAGAAALVKNKPRDQVATRIPFEGRFGDPKVGFFTTVMNLFRHGFIQAFNPTIEGSINADNVLPNGKSANGDDVSKNPPAK